MVVIQRDSAGYGGLMNTPLARVDYHDKIMMRYEERDFLAEITNSDISERIESCGQMVQILMPPEVGPWRTYHVNQPMINSQVSITATCLSICNAAYQSIKFDELTINAACKNWQLFEEGFLDANYEAFVAFQREWVLSHMIAAVSPRNQGSNAGINGNVDLGRRSNPIVITKNNIAVQMAQVYQVLMEQLHWVRGQMFMLVPPEMTSVLIGSNFANAGWVGNTGMSMAIDGVWPHALVGFNLIESIYVPRIREGNRMCYYILAGHKEAYTYAANIIRSRIVSGIDSFSVMYQMLAVWGGDILRPNFLALAYWTFDPFV